MTTESVEIENQPRTTQVTHEGGGSNAVYGLGIFGAWAYYFKRASTPEERIKAFFKGLVWPAFLVYELLVFLDKER